MVQEAKIKVMPLSGHQTRLSENLRDLHPDVTVTTGSVWVLTASCDGGRCGLDALKQVVTAEGGHFARCGLLGSRIFDQTSCAECQRYSHLK